MEIDPVELGKSRQSIHSGHSTPRFFEDENTEDIIGAFGEVAFSELTGIPCDTELKPQGDNGRDFEALLKFRIDIKTARKPYNLLVKVNEINRPVDIYVLAAFDESTNHVEFIGWQWKSVMKVQPTRDFGYGIVNHYMNARKLRPMNELINRIVRGGGNGF